MRTSQRATGATWDIDCDESNSQIWASRQVYDANGNLTGTTTIWD